MKKIIDLHTHSSVSDGTMSPAELVRHAKNNNIQVLSLTDHDSVLGIEEAIEESKKAGIKFIPGVEISVDFYKEIHILGYFNENNFKKIIPFLEVLRINRNSRNSEMIEKLRGLGINITLDDVLNETCTDLVSRLHFAKTLVKKGICENVKSAFDKYLGNGGQGYVNKYKVSPQVGINEIVKASGIAVLAHPMLIGISFEELEEFIQNTLIKAGLSGIEVYYSENTEFQTQKTLEICNKYKLLPTGGSDFHGSNKEGIKIGVGMGNLQIDYKIALELIKKITESA